MHRTIAIASLTAVIFLSLATAALAASPRIVDPASVTPPLNPDFTWSCFDTGAGPICQGTLQDAYANEPIDITCDGDPVYVSGVQTERMTRWHLPDGRATKTVVGVHFTERLSLSPSGDEPTVRVRSHWNRHYTYLVPGDRSTRVLTETGAEYLATAPGHGVVFKDVGLIRWTPGNEFDEVDVIHGQRDFHTDVAGVVESVCAVLR
jgi:hypothetical protein